MPKSVLLLCLSEFSIFPIKIAFSRWFYPQFSSVRALSTYLAEVSSILWYKLWVSRITWCLCAMTPRCLVYTLLLLYTFSARKFLLLWLQLQSRLLNNKNVIAINTSPLSSLSMNTRHAQSSEKGAILDRCKINAFKKKYITNV